MKPTTLTVIYRQGMRLAAAWSLVLAATPGAMAMEEVPLPRHSIAIVQSNYGKLPLSFEANHGQVDEQVRFLARGPGYRLFLTPSESVLVLQQREPTTEPPQRGRGEPIARPEPSASTQAVV